jgi:hypothetical protein
LLQWRFDCADIERLGLGFFGRFREFRVETNTPGGTSSGREFGFGAAYDVFHRSSRLRPGILQGVVATRYDAPYTQRRKEDEWQEKK